MSDHLKSKRVTFKNAQKNKKIIDLLEDFYNQVEGKDQKAGQKIKLAISSLSKYPLQINSGEDCIIIQGFDKNLCRYVDEKLFMKNKMAVCDDKLSYPAITIQGGNICNPSRFGSMAVENNNEENVDSELNTELAKPISLREKQKIIREALILGMYIQQVEYPSRSALTKTELMIVAQEYCEENIEDFSFVKLLEKNKQLLEMELVDGIELYKLTYFGEAMAKMIIKNSNELGILKTGKCSHKALATDAFMFIDMPPESYKIIMLVDKNEPVELLKIMGSDRMCESRSLKVGDIAWVARSKNGQELMLPFILERKRMDDLAASIKDGRFHEQKFRLSKCGLRNVIYLVENYQWRKYSGLPMATLVQAMVNTRVQDGFLIRRSNSLKCTKTLLDMITVRLSAELTNMHLRGSNIDSGGKELMTFDYFNATSSKTKPLTVKELFIKMLLQLKGLSVEKALAITNKYDSPKALMDAYVGLDTRAGEFLLANLRLNITTQRVGPAISKVLYMLFNRM